MIGSLRWNIIAGTIGFILTILLSINHNVFLTSVIRGAYTFATLFVFTFIVRWFMYYIVNIKQGEARSQASQTSSTSQTSEDEAQKGTHIDLSTPEQDVSAFSPLNPPQYETKQNVEDVVKVIRHMSED